MYIEDFVYTELTGTPYTDSATSITVSDASVFADPDTVGDYEIVIQNKRKHPGLAQNHEELEVVLLTARDTGTNTLTITRNSNGKEAVAFGDTIDWIVYLGATKQVFDDKQYVLSEGAFVDGDKTKLDGVESSADVTDAGNVGSSIEGVASVTPADTDKFAIVDDTDTSLKSVLWSSIKTALDAIYVKVSDIVDNLTSTDTNKPLSANQGKQLNDSKANLSGGNTWSGVQDFGDRIDLVSLSFDGGVNVLSDYEKGTFTGTLTTNAGDDGITSNTDTCFYERIGGVCIVWGEIGANTPSSFSTYINDDDGYSLNIDGLPFTIYNDIQGRSAPVVGTTKGVGCTGGYLAGIGSQNTTTILFQVNKDDGSVRTSPNLTTNDSIAVHFQFTYKIA
ncbi:hypothetical protein [Gracilimonas sp.]|uniref:hypothetical protein n=1 Tax=Gracilimonas sp. TaxID=1974203 RepID=UPI002871CF89|nr:hypothetical protein [Gracilimonas sp.]